jgi:glycosyltransferase involved in cell wall biosynthesis
MRPIFEAYDPGVGRAAAKRPLTVAFLSPAWPPGAAENGIVSYVAGITAALRQLGHTPCILSSHTKNAKPLADVYPLEWERRSPLARIRDGLSFRINPSAALRQRFSRALVQAARRAIAERGVELLEMEETFGLVQLVKPRLPIPVVTRLHGPHFVNGAALGVPADAAFHRRVRHEGFAIAKADAVSAPSRDILERTRAYYGLPLKGVALIPNPGPVVRVERRWSHAECDPSRLLFVGRFDRHKGGDIVIDAFNQVAQRYRDVRLWFAGPDRGLKDEHGRHWTLPNYIAERAHDVAGRIDWLGPQPYSALAELRRKAFVTIVGSRYETLGIVVLEALACGCPLVATRTGGIVEIIEDRVNGVLARPGDPDDLAAAVLRLLGAPEFAADLGRRAAEDATRRYHPEVIARQTAAFHQSVLDSRSRHALCSA